MRYGAPHSATSHRLQPGVSRHQPFNTLALERHLQTAMLTAAFHIDDGAFTKLSVAYAPAELVAAVFQFRNNTLDIRYKDYMTKLNKGK